MAAVPDASAATKPMRRAHHIEVLPKRTKIRQDVAASAHLVMQNLTTQELHDKHLNDDATILDARSAEEYASGHIKGAINIPHTDVAARLSEIPKDKPVMVHCAMGGRAKMAAQVLEANGYEVWCVSQGGMREWAALHLPTTT